MTSLVSNVTFIKDYTVETSVFLLYPSILSEGSYIENKSIVDKIEYSEKFEVKSQKELKSAGSLSSGSFIKAGSVLRISNVSIKNIPYDYFYKLTPELIGNTNDLSGLANAILKSNINTNKYTDDLNEMDSILNIKINEFLALQSKYQLHVNSLIVKNQQKEFSGDSISYDDSNEKSISKILGNEQKNTVTLKKLTKELESINERLLFFEKVMTPTYLIDFLTSKGSQNENTKEVSNLLSSNNLWNVTCMLGKVCKLKDDIDTELKTSTSLTESLNTEQNYDEVVETLSKKLTVEQQQQMLTTFSPPSSQVDIPVNFVFPNQENIQSEVLDKLSYSLSTPKQSVDYESMYNQSIDELNFLKNSLGKGVEEIYNESKKETNFIMKEATYEINNYKRLFDEEKIERKKIEDKYQLLIVSSIATSLSGSREQSPVKQLPQMDDNLSNKYQELLAAFISEQEENINLKAQILKFDSEKLEIMKYMDSGGQAQNCVPIDELTKSLDGFKKFVKINSNPLITLKRIFEALVSNSDKYSLSLETISHLNEVISSYEDNLKILKRSKEEIIGSDSEENVIESLSYQNLEQKNTITELTDKFTQSLKSLSELLKDSIDKNEVLQQQNDSSGDFNKDELKQALNSVETLKNSNSILLDRLNNTEQKLTSVTTDAIEMAKSIQSGEQNKSSDKSYVTIKKIKDLNVMSNFVKYLNHIISFNKKINELNASLMNRQITRDAFHKAIGDVNVEIEKTKNSFIGVGIELEKLLG